MSDELTPKEQTIVFLCECGPIIKELVDLDALGERAGAMPQVGAVVRHATLCSADGKQFIAEQLREHPGMRPVFAACTPREHAEDLGSACEEAGVNRYLMGRANIREQCAWVTPDKAEATLKAGDLVEAAVARSLANEPLTAPQIACETGVLVIGAGAAGMNAALMLADAGRKVTLVEREPSIGGRVVMLGEIYPDMDCAPCLMEPLMDHVMHHDHIEVLLQSELEELVGYLGNYTARVRVNPRHVDVAGCFACRSCSEVCPVTIPDVANCGMSERKAISIPYTGALPNASVIDEGACLHFNGGECEACVSACAFGAIDLGGEPEFVERAVGGVLLATGSELRTVGSIWDNPAVVTTYEFERILNPDGPTAGEVRVPGSEPPKTIALVHCCNESGEAPVAECSKTCCLSLAKAVHEIAHKSPEVQVVEFAWDRVLGGPHYKNDSGQQVVRPDAGTTARVTDDGAGGAVVEFTYAGQVHTARFDLVVAAPPQCGASSLDQLATDMGVDQDKAGFVLSANRTLKSFAARKDGIFVAGCAQSPKDVADSVSQGAAAAGALLSGLAEGAMLEREAATAYVDEDLCGGCTICVLSCPFKAISFDAENHVAIVNELLCHGCGTCVAACPSSAITGKHFSDVQIGAEIGALARAARYGGFDE